MILLTRSGVLRTHAVMLGYDIGAYRWAGALMRRPVIISRSAGTRDLRSHPTMSGMERHRLRVVTDRRLRVSGLIKVTNIVWFD